MNLAYRTFEGFVGNIMKGLADMLAYVSLYVSILDSFTTDSTGLTVTDGIEYRCIGDWKMNRKPLDSLAITIRGVTRHKK